MASPYYVNIKDYNYSDLSKLLKTKITGDSTIKALSLDENGFVDKLQVDESVFIGDDIVKMLNIKSRAIKTI